ncbi:MAG: hypothetical protein OXK79_02415 [Chloroflexota bacterium]|nr:hypothetical protein [Chloroflexota bacterium]
MSVDLARVIDRTLLGFSKAERQLEKLSGGWGLWWAPEYFATVAIAKQVHKLGCDVTVEQSIAEALERAGRRKKPPPDLPKAGRFDLAVWRESGEKVKGIIEVKMTTYMTYGTVEGDVERVCTALDRAKKLEWGLVAYHNTAWNGVGKPASKRIETRADSIEARSRKYVEDSRAGLCCSRHVGEMTVDDDRASRAEVLAIARAGEFALGRPSALR